MEALGISYLKLSPCKYYHPGNSGEFGLSRGGGGGDCFLFYQKGVGRFVGVSISVGFQQSHNCIHSVSVASSAPSSSSDTQATVESEEVLIPYADLPKTVRVKFKLLKECAFGQKFLIVGDDSMFGSWDPSEGVPLNWSDGHVWTAELEFPTDKTVKYKVILQENAGTILWQPGPDRVLETWDTEKIITVSEHWDNPELRDVVEEDLAAAGLNEEPLPDSDLSLVSENPSSTALLDDRRTTTLLDDHRTDLDKEGGASSNGYSNLEDKKPSAPMVAENIAEPLEEQDSSTDDELSNLIHVNSSSLKQEIMVDEGIPVLVPGLISMPPEETEEPSPDEEDGISIETNSSSGSDEVEITTPEPEIQKIDEEKVTVLKNQYNAISPQRIRETIEEKEMIGKSKEHYGRVQLENSVLESDVQWGRRTLQKFLATLGFQTS